MRAGWLVAAVSAVVVLTGVEVLPASAVEPHEDPNTAPWVFDGVSVLHKYAEALNHVLARDGAPVEILRAQASLANIPSELRDTVDDFLSAGQSMAQLIAEIETTLESSRTMLSQFRPTESERSSALAEEKLTKAYSELQVLERTAQGTAQWWRADTAAEGSALRQAYGEVEARLLRLRSLLDLLSEVHRSLSTQAEVISSISQEGEILRPTAITMGVDPPRAFVGDLIGVEGRLSADGMPLAGRKVTVLLDGSPALTVQTDGTGAYLGQILLPYHYVNEMRVQALYFPEGADLGLYLGSSSPEVVVGVLFYYAPALNLVVPGEAYPGRTLTLKGSFDYGGDPVPDSRSLNVRWDGQVVAEETVGVDFALELPLSEEASLGTHQVTVYVSPQKRYGPAWASAQVEVARATPVIEVEAPGVALLPFALDVRGSVYSTLGPLQYASLRIGLGSWEVTTRSREDGTFEARLGTGMSLTLLGKQELRVTALPIEPWHRAGSVATGMLVVNPANIAGIVLALSVSVFLGVRGARKRALRAATALTPEPAPVLVRMGGPQREAQPSEPEASGGPRALLLALYRGVLRIVEKVTAVVLRPSYTLREFAEESAPRLGPLAQYFEEFTTMIERLLYSRTLPGEVEATRAGELSQQLKEGLKGEGS